MAGKTYEELAKLQLGLYKSLEETSNKLKAFKSIELTHRKIILDNLNDITDESAENHEALVHDEDNSTRSYFTNNTFSKIHVRLDECFTLLNQLPVEPQQPDSSTQGLQAQINLLLAKVQDSEKANGTEQVLVNLISELKAGRVQLKFPGFPKDNVHKKYRDWRAGVMNFVTTNPSNDSVQIQHLKAAVIGTEAEPIVSLFSVHGDTFSAAMESLDNRFMVARIIITEFLNSVVNISPSTQRGSQNRHLKEVLDNFNAFEKNIAAICKDSLIARGEDANDRNVINAAVLNAICLALLLRTLDDYTKTQLSSTLNLQPNELPIYKTVTAALEKRLIATNTADKPKSSSHLTATTQVRESNYKNIAAKCIVCKVNSHSTNSCFKLMNSNLPFKEKTKLLRNNASKVSLCWICLQKPYNSCDCRRTKRCCPSCKGLHHLILCGKKSTNDRSKDKRIKENSETTAVAVGLPSVSNVAVIGTILLKVQASNGRFVTLRAMTDDGSTTSFITTAAAQRIGCNMLKTFKTIQTMNGTLLPNIQNETALEIQNLAEDFKHTFSIENVAVTKRLPLVLPSKPLKLKLPKELKAEIQFADPTFHQPGGIDILLGVGPWSAMKIEGSIAFGETKLQNSIFGHVVQGLVEVNDFQTNAALIVATVVSAQTVSDIKSDFRKVFEYVPEAEEENNYAENLFVARTTRLENGTYQVPLIWSGNHSLGDSYKVCYTRNKRAIEKLTPVQLTQLMDVIDDYKRKGIISVCTDVRQGKYYAPFVFVFRPGKATTPMRLCLDGAQKSSNGYSVNDLQLVGAQMIPDITEQLLKFRQHRFAVISDVAQMYLSIMIRPEDRAFQRSLLVLPNQEVQEIEYNSVLFGATCSPFLSQRVMLQLAIDEGENFPLAASVLKDFIYIDDICYSLNNKKLTKQTLEQLLGITEKANLKLHKIASNSEDILDQVPTGRLLSAVDDKPFTSVLGIQWEYKCKDEIFINLKLNPIVKLTKRTALSALASIFDPLGVVSPVLMPARFIIQEVWQRDRELKTNELAQTWDKALDPDLEKAFFHWYDGLKGIENYRFPRCVGFSSSLNQQIYVFVDSSQKGFGAVCYLRTVFEDGEVTFSLLCAKGKVAPIVYTADTIGKRVTIPRLELMSAVVGSQLVSKVKRAWKLDEKFPIFMFTDAEIVLAQISSTTIRDVFTENRLKKIRALVGREHWFHVSTAENPADILSRGCEIEELKGIWEKGPPSMRDKDFVPRNKFLSNESTENIVAVTIMSKHSRVPNELPFTVKFSSHKKTCRVMAVLLRAALAFKTTCQSFKLDAADMQAAELKLIQISQERYFGDEIKCLKKGQIIKTGVLLNQNAFLDKNGVIRIATRIQFSEVDYNQRNPMVLPPLLKTDTERHIGHQVLFDTHVDSIHGGLTSMMSEIRQRFFIPNLRASVKSHIKKCQLCERIKAKMVTQIMGNLPRENVEKSPAFWHCTIDYCGPISIKTRLRVLRKNKTEIEQEVGKATRGKAWILVIVCLSTRAYHLELVKDLTSNSFLQAFDNFISVRGKPASIRSDNASTFHRAADLLKGAYDIFKQSLTEGFNTLMEKCATENIQWHFNPPLGSHHGGVHERAIRSVRDKMRRSFGLEVLSFPDLYASLKRIEAILNSRPLLRVPGDYAEGDVCLTPGHLLIGRPITMLPSIEYPTKESSLYQAYKARVRIEDFFWKHFYASHFNELAMRSKWYFKRTNLKVGDLVLLYEENTPPLSWRKGIVIETMPDKEGNVRVVLVKTAFGEFERPITKLALIPGPNDEEHQNVADEFLPAGEPPDLQSGEDQFADIPPLEESVIAIEDANSDDAPNLEQILKDSTCELKSDSVAKDLKTAQKRKIKNLLPTRRSKRLMIKHRAPVSAGRR